MKTKLSTIRYASEDLDTLRNNGVSIVAFLDTHRPMKDGTLIIRLRIIYDRIPKYYSTGITTTVEDYKIITDSTKRPRGEIAMKRTKIQAKLKEAYDIIISLDPFTWNDFKNKYQKKGTTYATVWDAFNGHIQEYKAAGQFGTAETYVTAQNSLKHFKCKGTPPSREQLNNLEYWSNNGKVLRFTDIDVKFLEQYDRWMQEAGKSVSTISMNTRCIRKLFNSGIQDNKIDKKIYPFGSKKKGKYAPPEHENNKRPLQIEDIQKLYEFDSDNKTLLRHRDMFLFSYLCYGLNMADVCRLKYSDIDSKYIELKRQKTAHNPKTWSILILLTEDHKRIIEKYGTAKQYVFDIINTKMTEEQKRLAIKQNTHNMNDNLKRIAGMIDITPKLSSMFARHSFASIARDAKIPESTISQCMGHTRGFGITGQYFGQVPDKMLKRVSNALLSFKYKTQLTDLEQFVFDKLPEAEQAIFLKLSSEEKQNFILKMLAEKLH